MAARGPHPFILLLLAACLALICGHSWNPLHDLFQKDHVDSPKTRAINNNAYCNKMMWERLLYWKYSNIFIHSISPASPNATDTVKEINDVCTTDGMAAGVKKRQSNKDFRITICTFNLWRFSYTGVSSTAKIVISCWDRLAVFLVKTV